MLKTNTMKARANLLRYIRDWDEDYLEERNEHCGYGYDLSDDDQLCKLIWECFKSEMSGDRRPMSEQLLFQDWAQGLALGGLFCYYYNRSAVEDLGNILEETEEERNQFTEEQAEDRLTYMIFCEVRKRASR